MSDNRSLSDINQRIAQLSPEQRARLEAKLMEQHTARAHDEAIPRRGVLTPCPMSFAQQRLWFLVQMDPESPHYNESKAIRMQGVLKVAALQQALEGLVARHETLRTAFIEDNGRPMQAIMAPRAVDLPVLDLRTWSAAEREGECQRLIREAIRHPFDLSHDLVLRALLLRLGDEEYVFLLVIHHIATDGWSMGILLREFAVLYDACVLGRPSPLPELPIQYADYALWQRQWLQGEELEARLTYWKSQLNGVPARLELPTDRPRPAIQTYQGRRQALHLPLSLTEALKTLGREEAATLFMVLLTGWKTLLHRYSNQEHIVVGSPVAGRTRPGIEELIGFFVNTLVLHTDLSGNPTFREALQRVRGVALGAYDHQDLPFEKLVEELRPERHLGRSPLFQVMFAFQNVPREPLQLSELTLTSLDTTGGTAKFDLSLYLWEDAGGLRGTVEYNTDLFDHTTIERMQGHFQTLLKGIAANPDQPISDLPLLTEREHHQLLVEWNTTQTDYPNDQCLHHLLEAQVARTPDALAVVFEGERLTYGQLNGRANQFAHHLQALGVGPDVLVGLCVERSLEMVVGLLGILKAGGAYVPLDPEYPSARVAFMIEDTQVPVLLTQARLVAGLPEHQAHVVCLDADWSTIAREGTENPDSGAMAAHLAYVIYTSGSTGKPKGVMNTHRGICNRLLWMQDTYALTSGDRVLQKTPFSFDVSVWEFFWPLLVGARLVVAPLGAHRDAAYLVHVIRSQAITTLHFVLSMLQVFLEAREVETCQSLRRVICSGEALSYDLQERFFARLEAELHNLYGPTETAVDVTYWACQPSGEHAVVPIGRPVANTQIYILSDQLQPAPIGVPGELHIGGVQVARGYLNRPELTAERFIRDPFCDDVNARLYKTGDLARYLPDGKLEFLGRLDHQVKIRGFRIELGEIETVLGDHPAVQNVLVLAREEPGDQRLVAYVVSQPEMTVESHDLRRLLRQKLPDYMVPSAFVVLDSLPLTPNGKVDRRALPTPSFTRHELEDTFVQPRDDIEGDLTKIWQEVLSVEPIGIRDNFFDLDGHSLLAVRLFAQIEKRFDQRLPLATLFEAPTVEHLAAILRQENWSAPWSSLVAIQPHGSKSPFFCMHPIGGDVLHFRDIARHLGPDQPLYALRAVGFDGAQLPHTRVEDMAAHYITEMRQLQPEGPYSLGGGSFGGVVAYEVAQQLRAQGHEVAFLAMFDTAGPNYRQSLGMRIR